MADYSSFRLKVPSNQREGLKRLIGLTDAHADALHTALLAATPSADASGIVSQIQAAVPLDIGQLTEVVTVLLGLAFTRTRAELRTEQVADAVASAAADEQLLESGPDARERFARRLALLLSVDRAIGTSAKAFELLLRYKNTFVAARVVSDIRTVLADSPTPAPVAAIIVHNLDITSHTDEQHVTHYFALDVGDLRLLKATIDRALEKEAVLKETIEAAGITYLDASQSRLLNA